MMKKLTKAEEELMHGIWELKECTVSNLIEHLYRGLKKPPHSSVSTIVRVLQKKGFIDHKTYGRTHVYFPLLSKEKYASQSVAQLKEGYFKNSAANLVSFLVKEEELDIDELSALLEKLKNTKNK